MKKIIFCLLIGLFMCLPTNVSANEKTINSTSIEYLDDGSYYVVLIEEVRSLTRATSTKTGTKTTKYVDTSGKTVWQVSVTGKFSFNGTSSSCTSSSVNATSYTSNWVISNKKTSKNGSTATASATAKRYYSGSLIDTKSKTVTLTCTANGILK